MCSEQKQSMIQYDKSEEPEFFSLLHRVHLVSLQIFEPISGLTLCYFTEKNVSTSAVVLPLVAAISSARDECSVEECCGREKLEGLAGYRLKPKLFQGKEARF